MKFKIISVLILIVLQMTNCVQKEKLHSIILPEISIQDIMYYEVLEVFHDNDSVNFTRKNFHKVPLNNTYQK